MNGGSEALRPGASSCQTVMPASAVRARSLPCDAAVLLMTSLALSACNPFEPAGGFEYKDCRHALETRADHDLIAGLDRLVIIDQCMAGKGLRPSPKCVAAGAQGKPHCEYERS